MGIVKVGVKIKVIFKTLDDPCGFCQFFHKKASSYHSPQFSSKGLQFRQYEEFGVALVGDLKFLVKQGADFLDSGGLALCLGFAVTLCFSILSQKRIVLEGTDSRLETLKAES